MLPPPIQPLTSGDLDGAAEIESRLKGRGRSAFLAKRFEAAAADPAGFAGCAARGEGGLEGYAFARILEGEFGTIEPVAELDLIGVDPEVQGRGLGQALLASLAAKLAEGGVGRLRTQVAWSDRAMVRFFSAAGFLLAPERILERDTGPLLERGSRGGSDGDLSRDMVRIRSLEAGDLEAVCRIDQKLTNRSRRAFLAAKFREVLGESGIRVSLVSEEDGLPTGYAMARVDYGEFGRLERTAVLDILGVHPDFKGRGIGHALLSQLLLNLSALRIETVRTQVGPTDFDLARFLHACGFRQSQRLLLERGPAWAAAGAGIARAAARA